MIQTPAFSDEAFSFPEGRADPLKHILGLLEPVAQEVNSKTLYKSQNYYCKIYKSICVRVI